MQMPCAHWTIASVLLTAIASLGNNDVGAAELAASLHPTVRIQPLPLGAQFSNSCEPSKRAELIYEDGIHPIYPQQICLTSTSRVEVFIDAAGKPYVLRQDSYGDGKDRWDYLDVLRPLKGALWDHARLYLRTSSATPPDKVREFWAARNTASGAFEITMTEADHRGQATTEISRVSFLPAARPPEVSLGLPSRITAVVRHRPREKSYVDEPCGPSDPVALSVMLNGHTFATHNDCSARDAPEAQTFTYQANRTYVAFFRAPRGNAVYRELELFQVERKRLRRIMRTALHYPLDGGTEYETAVTSALDAGALKLTLRGRTLTTSANYDQPKPLHEDPSRAPDEQTWSIWINPDAP